MSKITLSTIKSFVRKNGPALHILTRSRFDGMTDGCESTGDREFTPVLPSDIHAEKHTLGIAGAWFVGSSRDYFTAFEKDGFQGYEVYNCCGHFTLAVPIGSAA